MDKVVYKSLNKINNFVDNLNNILEEEFNDSDELIDKVNSSNEEDAISYEIMNKFFEAMDDDFNTPKAISAIFEFINESKNIESYDIANLLAIKKWFNGISFIFGIDFNQKQSSLEDNNDENWVELILSIREKLRQNKQYDLSDEIRDELNKRGIEVSDS